MVMIMGYCHIMKSLGYYPTLKVQNRYPSGSKHGWVGNSRTKIIALWTAGRFTEVHRKKMRNQHDFPGLQPILEMSAITSIQDQKYVKQESLTLSPSF